MIAKSLTILKRVLLSTFLVCCFMVVTQDVQIFPGLLPGFFTSKSRESNSPAASIESRFISTSDGERIELWLHPVKEDLASTTPLGIIFHGNAETVDSTLPMLRWLQSAGISAVSFDYRGYNKSSGWPSDTGLKADVNAVISHLRAHNNLDERPVLLLGSSIGTGLAAYAAQQIKPAAVALMAPYTSLKELVSELPLFGFLHPFVWYDLNVLKALDGLSETCLILVHGERDTTIPITHSETLFSKAKKFQAISFIKDSEAGHNDLFARTHPRLAEAIRTCLFPATG